jgi:hypothetical protein
VVSLGAPLSLHSPSNPPDAGRCGPPGAAPPAKEGQPGVSTGLALLDSERSPRLELAALSEASPSKPREGGSAEQRRRRAVIKVSPS